MEKEMFSVPLLQTDNGSEFLFLSPVNHSIIRSFLGQLWSKPCAAHTNMEPRNCSIITHHNLLYETLRMEGRIFKKSTPQKTDWSQTETSDGAFDFSQLFLPGFIIYYFSVFIDFIQMKTAPRLSRSTECTMGTFNEVLCLCYFAGIWLGHVCCVDYKVQIQDTICRDNRQPGTLCERAVSIDPHHCGVKVNPLPPNEAAWNEVVDCLINTVAVWIWNWAFVACKTCTIQFDMLP